MLNFDFLDKGLGIVSPAHFDEEQVMHSKNDNTVVITK